MPWEPRSLLLNPGYWVLWERLPAAIIEAGGLSHKKV
jgi:hypothetical protein